MYFGEDGETVKMLSSITVNGLEQRAQWLSISAIASVKKWQSCIFTVHNKNFPFNIVVIF
jgi:hypothetical protein